MAGTVSVEPGDLIVAKYRVEAILGRGGMGVVVAATHLDLQERVALKFLLPEALGDAEAVERFLREARASRRLRSAHVAKVIDVGRLDAAARGAPFLVMEYLEGADLAHLLAGDGPLEVSLAVDYVLQACDALSEAHAEGFIHRDVKPSNLFLTQDDKGAPIVKVLDFGVAKHVLTSGDGEVLTRTAAVVGSVEYMSPEQMRASRDVDSRTDVWSLGVTLYELLAAQRPFSAETLPHLCARVFSEPPRPLPELVPDVPPDLWAAIARCLQKAPEARFSTMGELAEAIAPFGSGAWSSCVERAVRMAAGRPISASSTPLLDARATSEIAATVRAPSPAASTDSGGPRTKTDWGASAVPEETSTPRKRRAPLVAGVVLALGAAFALVWVSRGDRPVAPPVSSAPAALTTKVETPMPSVPSPIVAAVEAAPSASATPSAPSAPSAPPAAKPPPVARPRTAAEPFGAGRQ